MGNYLSCSERAGKYTYTWWTNQIWRPSVLVLLSSKLSYKLKTWLHQGWFVVLAHSEICWSILISFGTHSCISMVYSDSTEYRRKMRSNQNVYESWSYLKLQASQTFGCWPHQSLWTIIHMIWNWKWFWGMCCRKIWGIGACTVIQIFRSMYLIADRLSPDAW